MTGETGSYRYMAPEVFKSEPCKPFFGPLLTDTERAAFCTRLCDAPLRSLRASCGADNAKVDVYAFSMILFELLEGELGDAPSAFFCLPVTAVSRLHGMGHGSHQPACPCAGYIPFLNMHPVDAAKQAAIAGKRPLWGTKNRCALGCPCSLDACPHCLSSLCSGTPHVGTSGDERCAAVCRWGEEVPKELKALTERCWSADYESRPNFDEICDILEEQLKRLGKDKMCRGSTATTGPAAAGGTGSGGCCSVM